MRKYELDTSIYQHTVKKNMGKFQYTLEHKLPKIKKYALNYEYIFHIYFAHGCKFDIYFFSDLLKYLGEVLDDVELKKEIAQYAAVHCLFNRNTLYMKEDNYLYGFTRINDKVYEFKFYSLQEMKRKLPHSLCEIVC